MITRFGLIYTIGRKRFDTFLVYFSPLALLGLLYTIIIIFAQQAKHILANLGPVFRVFVPMIMYFTLMFCATFAWSWYWSRKRGLGRRGYEIGCVQSFTAASNNFVRVLGCAKLIDSLMLRRNYPSQCASRFLGQTRTRHSQRQSARSSRCLSCSLSPGCPST